MKQSLLLFLSIALVAFSSCKKDENDVLTPETNPASVNTVTNLNASGADNYILFNFASNSIIPSEEIATTKWDIGFKKTTIIVNGGDVRTGNAGAVVYNGIFDDMTEIPEDIVFAQDITETDLAIPTGSGNGWYNYDMSIHGVTPTAGKFLIIRTADNKYAKMEIVSYYKDMPIEVGFQNPNGGYYSFRYAYQADGSKKF